MTMTMTMNQPKYERLHDNLKKLKLEHIEKMLDNYLETVLKDNKPVLEILDHLINEQCTTNEQNYLDAKMRLALFPYKKAIDDFDFSFQPSIDKQVIDELCTMRFIHNAENVILLGPPGVGKTHLAIALGIEAIKAGLSAYFTTAHNLIKRLQDANKDGKLESRLRALCKRNIVIVDEIGYLPLSEQDANLFFQFVARRYEKGSLVITSNRSFGDWGKVFHDEVLASALLDRLLHHSTIINIRGDSYRLKEKMKCGLFERNESEK